MRHCETPDTDRLSSDPAAPQLLMVEMAGAPINHPPHNICKLRLISINLNIYCIARIVFISWPGGNLPISDHTFTPLNSRPAPDLTSQSSAGICPLLGQASETQHLINYKPEKYKLETMNGIVFLSISYQWSGNSSVPVWSIFISV